MYIVVNLSFIKKKKGGGNYTWITYLVNKKIKYIQKNNQLFKDI